MDTHKIDIEHLTKEELTSLLDEVQKAHSFKPTFSTAHLRTSRALACLGFACLCWLAMDRFATHWQSLLFLPIWCASAGLVALGLCLEQWKRRVSRSLPFPAGIYLGNWGVLIAEGPTIELLPIHELLKFEVENRSKDPHKGAKLTVFAPNQRPFVFPFKHADRTRKLSNELTRKSYQETTHIPWDVDNAHSAIGVTNKAFAERRSWVRKTIIASLTIALLGWTSRNLISDQLYYQECASIASPRLRVLAWSRYLYHGMQLHRTHVASELRPRDALTVARGQGRAADLYSFISKYPESPWVTEIQSRELPTLVFEEISRSPSEERWRSFLRQHSGAQEASAVRRTHLPRAAWSELDRSNISEIRAFLREFPTSDENREARSQIDALLHDIDVKLREAHARLNTSEDEPNERALELLAGLQRLRELVTEQDLRRVHLRGLPPTLPDSNLLMEREQQGEIETISDLLNDEWSLNRELGAVQGLIKLYRLALVPGLLGVRHHPRIERQADRLRAQFRHPNTPNSETVSVELSWELLISDQTRTFTGHEGTYFQLGIRGTFTTRENSVQAPLSTWHFEVWAPENFSPPHSLASTTDANTDENVGESLALSGNRSDQQSAEDPNHKAVVYAMMMRAAWNELPTHFCRTLMLGDCEEERNESVPQPPSTTAPRDSSV